MPRKRSRKAFTIVELVIVIAVIAILATVLVPTFGDVISKANDSKAMQEAKNAYTEYLVKNGGTAPEVMVYMHANGKVVALENGVPVHVYETAAEFFSAYGVEEFAMTAGVIYTTAGEAGSGGSEENKQLFNPDDAAENYYINSTGAEEYSATSGGLTWYITDYMPVDGNNIFGYSNLNTAGSAPHSAFYDANKNLISVFKQVQGDAELEVPDNAVYVRFSVLQNVDGFFGFNFWMKKPEQMFVAGDATKNYYIDSTGTEVYSASSGGVTWHITDYMPVDGNNTYGYSNLNTAGSAPHSAFYDANKNLISVFKQVQGENVALVIPSNAAYVRFSVLQNASGVLGFAFWNGVSFEDEGILTDSDFWSKISICINGDSIETESAGLWSKMLRDQIAFENYKNIAVGGTRMKGEINSDERLNKIPENTDLLITAGGTNDWAQNVPLGSLDTLDDADTFYGAVHLYIQKVRDRFPDMIIVMASNHFGCCPGRFTESENVEAGIYNDINLSIADYAKAIKEVAEFNNTYYIPIYEECGINQDNYERYNLSEYNNYGHHVYLHPNSGGARKILDVYLNYLNVIADEAQQ